MVGSMVQRMFLSYTSKNECGQKIFCFIFFVLVFVLMMVVGMGGAQCKK